MLDTPQGVEQSIDESNKTDLSSSLPKLHKTSNKKIIFLTFDDGPLKGTKNVLAALQKEKVPATMFMVGSHIKMNKTLYQKAMASPYVTIANHTYSHANGHYQKFYSNKTKLLKDIRKTDTLISDANQTAKDSDPHPLRLAGRNVFRLPCLSYDDHGIGKCQCKKERAGYNKIAKAGFYIYGWDIEWHFNAKNGKPLTSPQKIVNKLEAMVASKCSMRHNKIILMMHDFMFKESYNGQKNLITLIRLLKQKGWKFAGIEEYI